MSENPWIPQENMKICVMFIDFHWCSFIVHNIYCMLVYPKVAKVHQLAKKNQFHFPPVPKKTTEKRNVFLNESLVAHLHDSQEFGQGVGILSCLRRS